MALLSFKDMMVVEYRPGEDELINYRAKRRKNGDMSEHHKKDADGNPIPHDDDEIAEALTLQQRMKRSRMMKRMKSRSKVGRDRARRKMADKKKLERRAMRQARNQIVRKLTKDIPKSELSFARKQEIEKRLDKPQFKARIKRMARKMFPKIRQAEVKRKKS